MHEPPFEVALFRDIGDLMHAAADSVERSTPVATAGYSHSSEPLPFAVERVAVVLDITPCWNRIVATLRRARPNEAKLAIALLRGIGDLVYAIADSLERNANDILDD